MLTSFREKALSAASQAGMVNNLNDGLAWGLFPLYFAAAGLTVAEIGVLAAIYPAVWGLGQLVTGGLSDRIGRKPLIAGGMLTQAVAIAAIASTSRFWAWAAGAAVLGAGTAMVYPTLLAAVGDVAHPTWRARSVGVYRLWRDGGFALGALLAGTIADAVSIEAAIWAVAALTAASGLVVLVRMYETLPSFARSPSRPTDVKVELLYFDDCPNWRVADEHLHQLATDHELDIVYRLVTTPEDAEALAFRGSPTVLIDGIDPFATGDEPVGLSCRIYQTPAGPAGAPTLEQLHDAIRTGQSRAGKHEIERDILDRHLLDLDDEHGPLPDGLVEHIDDEWPP